MDEIRKRQWQIRGNKIILKHEYNSFNGINVDLKAFS